MGSIAYIIISNPTHEQIMKIQSLLFELEIPMASGEAVYYTRAEIAEGNEDIVVYANKETEDE